MTDDERTYGDLGIDVPSVVTIDESDPETVEEFTHRDHYPDEVAEQWQAIRAGRPVFVDESGHEVDGRDGADYVLHPNYAMAGIPEALSGIGPDDFPPVTHTPVGRPDEVGDRDLVEDDFRRHRFLWMDRETGHLMACDEEKVVDWNESVVVEYFEWADPPEGDGP